MVHENRPYEPPKPVARSKNYMMDGLSWSPDGQIIAVNCSETTQTSSAGFYEFRVNKLDDVMKFSSVRPRDWSWTSGLTALVTTGHSHSWNLKSIKWNLITGTTQTSNIITTTQPLFGIRTLGQGQCVLQNQQGLLLVRDSEVTRIVAQPIQTWWYEKSTDKLYYIML